MLKLMAHWDDDDEMCKMRAVNNSNLFFGPPSCAGSARTPCKHTFSYGPLAHSLVGSANICNELNGV